MPKKSSAVRKKKKNRKVKKLQKHTFRNKLVGLLLLALALVLLFLPQILFSPRINNRSPIKINASLLASKVTQNDPIRILIPKIDIDLRVTDARIINGFWELSEDTASYGMGSGQPGSKSNTVIFAHAREGLFYNLKDVKEKDVVYVFTKNSWFRYKVNNVTQVYPSQTEVIGPTKSEVLTLYTCTGFYDEKRLIVTAIPDQSTN